MLPPPTDGALVLGVCLVNRMYIHMCMGMCVYVCNRLHKQMWKWVCGDGVGGRWVCRHTYTYVGVLVGFSMWVCPGVVSFTLLPGPNLLSACQYVWVFSFLWHCSLAVLVLF